MLRKSKSSISAFLTVMAVGSGISQAAVLSDLGNKISETTGVHLSNDELPDLSKGVQEFGLSGNLNWDTSTKYALDLSYGRFVAQGWMVGVKGGVIGENSDASFDLGLFTEYNFCTGTKWVPFVGLGADWARVNDGHFDADAVRLSGEFGVKYFLRANMALSASMTGSWISNTTPDGDDFGKQVNFGLRFYF
ncbi:hypothetical protein JIN85_13160 [Luteolibacter pohnpeiensis]|uniref:Outer membrane protein beta-barrel domain-containing protein n=1 Tax=Luteolibacter pohnpeiensis TaxID=454153 RepID=A0A934VWK3_9BACT|nr:outer membrane beta-barrel protein [Luteolibacter pohnpeiensis]MBK1883370.1 hypothetical protein [Luteolibacter pohnpeiensis]